MRLSGPAVFASGVAATLVIGGGTAVAANGGSFLLGHTNKATAATTLINPHGTVLALQAKSGKPALAVNTPVQVKNLNAELLGGHRPADFLAAGGKAADSGALDGHPASDFLPSTGTAADAAKLGGQPAASYVGTVYVAQTDADSEGSSTPLLYGSPAFDTLTLPAGTYNVALTADLVNTDTGPGEFGCYVEYTSGTTHRHGMYGNVSLNPAGGSLAYTYGNAAVNQVITLPATATISASCYVNAGDTLHTSNVYNSTLTATRVQDLHGPVYSLDAH